MTMLFIMGVLLVFTALGLLATAMRNAAPSTGVARSIELIEAMTTAPSELTKDLDKSFGERVLIPLQNRFSGLGRRLSGADSAERIRRKLDLAGNPPGWTVDRVMSGKVVGAMAGFVGRRAVLLHARRHRRPSSLVIVGATLAGFFAPTHVPLPARLRPLQADPARAPRRHRPAHHLGRVRPRLRRRAAAGGLQHRRAPGRRVLPRAARDADRFVPLRGPPGDWPSAPTSRSSGRSSARWCRPMPSASPSPTCCASSRPRCGSSAASVRRRRPSRSR